ncbi:DUF5325 family protein [Bacillus sp. FJAT-50079]|uniref:DUF5325 family protein n=1 Tax=Bacillus sp. FJAT-50079 TaxID=2833577 RepID=UPI001BC8CD55|nr:DUF5325 family protein [Bacillus sp. FJAT-50079]MBS4207767.1 DUF5325 family protein [Bacillus sp. FJAT-50079]
MIQWNALILAILGAFSIIAIGIFLGERSPIGMLISFIVFIIIMIIGFKSKKKVDDKKN